MAVSKQIIPNAFRMHNAQDFADSFATNTTFYAFAGKNYPYTGGDANVAQPFDDISTINFDVYQDMLFGKKVEPNNVKMMVKRNDWVSGTVYKQYDNKDPNLTSEQFYVGANVGSVYAVFKCLYNPGGNTASIDPPATVLNYTNFYETSDGYHWKYMYSVNTATFSSFATSAYVPVVRDQNVIDAATPGSIDVINVEYAGSGYTNHLTGIFSGTNNDITVNGNTLLYSVNVYASSITGIYNGCYLYITSGAEAGKYSTITSSFSNNSGKYVIIETPFENSIPPSSTYEISPRVTIFGPGDQTINAEARAILTGTTVSKVQILNPGEVFGYATANVYAYSSVGVTDPAVLRPIVSPIEGHGGNPEEELKSSFVGISVKFANTESGTIIANSSSYRTIGLIRDPLYANVTFDVSSVSSFVSGERINQANTTASGKIVAINATSFSVTNVHGVFELGDSSNNVIYGSDSGANCYITANIKITGQSKDFTTYNQTYTYTGTLTGSFSGSETVYQGSLSTSNAKHIFSNSTTLIVSNKLGKFVSTNLSFPNTFVTGNTSGAKFFINNIIASEKKPDIISGSGDVFYIENIEPITRSDTQTETLKMVISF